MYKDIFKQMVLLVSQPTKAWQALADRDETGEEVLARFVYPLFGALTVTAFLGTLLLHKGFDVQPALKVSIRELVAAFGGYFLAVYALNEAGWTVFKWEKDKGRWQRFVAYASCLMIALNVVRLLLPELFFLRVFQLYTFYIVWEGADVYVHTNEAERLKFTGIATAAILLAPYILRGILLKLMPGLNA